MNTVANQLEVLVKINNQILNILRKGETDIKSLHQLFEERGSYVNKLTELTSQLAAADLSAKQKKTLKSLFNQFADQQTDIQKGIDHLLNDAKEQLDDAITQNKAEQSYQVLNR